MFDSTHHFSNGWNQRQGYFPIIGQRYTFYIKWLHQLIPFVAGREIPRCLFGVAQYTVGVYL